MDFLQQLRKMPIFADLTDDQLRDIHTITTERNHRKGTIIFMEDEPGEGFHYLKAGKVKIVKMTDDGREHIINILSPGDLFAEVLLFNNGTYPATAMAVEDSKVGVIKNKDLERLILNNNVLALQLIKALSLRLLFAQKKIKNLALNDVTARTAETLLNLSKQHGKLLPGGNIELTLDLSRQELASLVGTTRETVTRTLSAMKKEKLIDFDTHKIVLLLPEQLKRLIQ